MGRKQNFLISALVVSFLYGGYYFGIPAIANLPSQKALIETTVKETLGWNLSLENPKVKMGVLPSVILTADSVKVLNPDNSEAFSTHKPHLKTNLLPLLVKKVSITKFSADTLSVNIGYDKNSQWRLGGYLIPDIQQLIKQTEMSDVTIDEYDINFKDELRKKDFSYSGTSLDLKEFNSNKHVKLSTKSTLKVNAKTSQMDFDIDVKLPLNKINENQFNITANVKDLDLSSFSEYASFFTNGEITKTGGIINIETKTTQTEDEHKNIISNITVKNLALLNNDEAKSIYNNGGLTVNANLNTIENGLHINNMKLSAKNINTELKGDITKITSKAPELDLDIKINKSRTESFIPLLPGDPDLSPDVNLYLLKKHPFYGDIVGELSLNGNSLTPNINGNIKVTDGYLIHRIQGSPKGADINLDFIKDKLKLDVIVPTNPTEKVFVDGEFELYGEKLAELNIKSTQNVNLKKAQLVLNPLHRILRFPIGPVPAMDINGIGNIDLTVKGTVENPHGFGQFNFRDAKVSFLDINNMVVEKGAGFLKFDDTDTYFENTEGVISGKPIKIKGNCNLYGVLDYNAKTENQDLGKLLNIVETSPMLADIQPTVAPIKSASGPANLNINLYGKVPDIEDMVFNKNLFAKGTIELLSNNIQLKDLPKPLTKTSGIIDFDNTDINLDLSSFIRNSQVLTKGKIHENQSNIKIVSNKFNAGDALYFIDNIVKLPFNKDFSTISSSFVASYNGAIDNINLENVNINGKIYSNSGAKSLIIVPNGTFSLHNRNLKLSPLQGTFNNAPYYVSVNATNAFSDNRRVNGEFKIKKLTADTLKYLANDKFLPPEIAKEIINIKDITGNADITAIADNNNLRLFVKPHNVGFTYAPGKMKMKLVSGDLSLKNDILVLNKLNSYLGEMPVLLDGKIGKITKKPYLDLYVNAKPTQEFFDQFFNNRMLYPIKTKGDIHMTTKLNGFVDNVRAKTELKVAENSNIYYMGATLGGADRVVKLVMDTTISPIRLKFNNFVYSYIIQSQNNKPVEMIMLNASGGIKAANGNNVVFENLKIKTQNPTDAMIFNIIFRKPFMKQGLFASDLTINGHSSNPTVRGFLDFTSIDMPFYDSTVKDIHVDFKPDDILLKLKSNVLTNDVEFAAKMKNSLLPPYILRDVDLQLADLNIDKILQVIRDLEIDTQRKAQLAKDSTTITLQPFDRSQLLIENATINADTIRVKNINAEDFTATLTLNDKMLFDIDKFKFNIASGEVNGSLQYNLLNNILKLSLDLKDADALAMSEALFDLKGQVYGNVTGNINLTCNGKNQESCTQTLYGDGNFVVKEGKMPKLGSLEYLLKAGNLINGGISGLSINGIIDLITPLKTGNFDDISGDITINSGIVDTINIYSRSRDLNMYMTGSYNIMNANADMHVYGSLTKNMTTVFGKIKNASLNTFLNTIPFMNKNEIDPTTRTEIEKIPNTNVDANNSRIFAVEILGDINGDAYVKSFKWVK